MKRGLPFLSALLLTLLAVASLRAGASPMLERVGRAQVVLSLNPDPPVVGTVHATVHVTGPPRDVLRHTTVRFRTAMTAMAMAGPSGVARPHGAPGDYAFDAAFQTATPWSVQLQFSGGLKGNATYRFAVISSSRRSGAGMKGSSTSANMSGMSSSPGNADAWRTAVFALIGLILIALFVLRRDRRPITLGMFVGAGLIVLILAVLQNRYAEPITDMTSMSSMRGGGATPVVLANVRSGTDGTDIFAPGTVEPYLTQDIVTRAPGILQNFNSYAGDRVSAGQVLATLDAPELGSQAQAAAADAQAQAAAARAAEIEAGRQAPANLSIAQNESASVRADLAAANADRRAKAQQLNYWNSEIAREQSLFDQGAVSQQELQDERAQAAVARAAYQGAIQHVASLQQQVRAAQARAGNAQSAIQTAQSQAQSAQAEASQAANTARAAGIMAAYRTVIAPDNAVVVKRLVDPGTYVPSGTPILRIAVVERVRIQANVAQGDLGSIGIGTPMEARLSNGKILRGRVSSIAPVADPTTHTTQVEAIVSGTSSSIVPGGYVRVTLHARGLTTPGGLLIPSAAIVGGGSDAAVWIDNNGTAHRIRVQVLSDDGTTALVKGALPPGARVVTDGANVLEEGQAITERRG